MCKSPFNRQRGCSSTPAWLAPRNLRPAACFQNHRQRNLFSLTKLMGCHVRLHRPLFFHLHPAPGSGANTYVDHLLYECASQSGAGFLPPSYHIKLNTVCTNQQNATYNGPANWPSLPSCSSPPASCARDTTQKAPSN